MNGESQVAIPDVDGYGQVMAALVPRESARLEPAEHR